MLKRIAIDNFRCFENFEFKPGPVQLLLGRNGAGKSSLLDVLSRVRQSVCFSRPVYETFSPSTRTRWSTATRQKVELDVAGDQGEFQYCLEVQHDEFGSSVVIVNERLLHNSSPIVRLIRDPRVGIVMEFILDDGQVFTQQMANPTQSALASFQPYQKLKRLQWFKNWLASLYCVRLDPSSMLSIAEPGGSSHPEHNFTNFASWYMHLVLERAPETLALRDDLRDAIPGFDSLLLQQGPQQGSRFLRTLFSKPGGTNRLLDEFDLQELSDGQRALIVLYTVLHCAMPKGQLVVFDEPDNYIALAEIQPWLSSVLSRVEDAGSQALFVSHHPELLNQLAPSHGVLLERENSGAVRITKYTSTTHGAITPAEEIARGWERE